MALFEYFPNYIWNLSVAIAMESGGKIGEIVDMCQPIKDAADSGADAHLDQARNTDISGRADAVGSRFEKRRGSNANRRQSDQAMESRDQFR